MIRVNGNVVCQFEVVHSLEDSESLTNGLYTNLFEGLLIEVSQYISGDVMFCEIFRDRECATRYETDL